uniref:Dirigent protein n=2 Tax=Cajanus cajan TaxID=3821 RepID=A0A151S0K5_CAJCA|nr:Disease resistance response protein 206 family [Cajanus cajan]
MAPTKFLSFTLLMISLCTSTTMFYEVNGQQAIETTLVFYLQDTATGPNASVSAVTGLNGRDWTYDEFGTIFAMDDPVMLGPSPVSVMVGRAQGVLAVSAQDAANVNAVISIVFTSLQYSGSTLEIQGVSRQRESYKELSVVSGTGRFRFARGYAVFETAFYDPQTAHSVIRLTINLRSLS